MRRTALAVLVSGVAAVAGAGGGVVPAGAAPAAGGPPVASGRGAAEHARVMAHWTDERRAAAVPRDVSPAAKPSGPGGGKGGGGGSGTVTGQAWTGGGDVVLTTGKVFFNLGAGTYVCSASAVATPARTAVVTAGHCVKDGAGQWATNWAFYPGYDGAPHPVLGGFTATDLFTTARWGSSGNWDDDAGFAAVTDGTTRPLEDAIQAAGDGSVHVPPIAFGPAASYHSFGYPAAKKYKGSTLVYCAGPATLGLDGRETMSIACDMTGGSSGGPWLETFGDGTSRVGSVNSYGYQSLSGTMFGPVFDSGERAAYDAAATGDCAADRPSTFHCVSRA